MPSPLKELPHEEVPENKTLAKKAAHRKMKIHQAKMKAAKEIHRAHRDNRRILGYSKEVAAELLSSPWKVFAHKYLYEWLGFKRFGITSEQIIAKIIIKREKEIAKKVQSMIQPQEESPTTPKEDLIDVGGGNSSVPANENCIADEK